MGVQEVGGTNGVQQEQGIDYNFLWKWKLISSIGNRLFFLYHRIVSAVKSLEVVSNRMSYPFLRVCWCDIIVVNVHARSEGKNDVSKDSIF